MCGACGHPSYYTSHRNLDCSATYSLRRSLFGDSLSLYDFWSRPWGVARLLELHDLLPCPIPRKGPGNNNIVLTPRTMGKIVLKKALTKNTAVACLYLVKKCSRLAASQLIIDPSIFAFPQLVLNDFIVYNKNMQSLLEKAPRKTRPQIIFCHNY